MNMIRAWRTKGLESKTMTPGSLLWRSELFTHLSCALILDRMLSDGGFLIATLKGGPLYGRRRMACDLETHPIHKDRSGDLVATH
jgi:hypothetical protein